MREYCFFYCFQSSQLKDFSLIADDNLVALCLFSKYLLELPGFDFCSYDAPCYCLIDNQWHNFTDKEITFFRKCIGFEK